MKIDIEDEVRRFPTPLLQQIDDIGANSIDSRTKMSSVDNDACGHGFAEISLSHAAHCLLS